MLYVLDLPHTPLYRLFRFMQMLASRLTAHFRKKCVVVMDRRVRLMNEILSCIKFIKMYCWESAFASNVHSKLRFRSAESPCAHLVSERKLPLSLFPLAF